MELELEYRNDGSVVNVTYDPAIPRIQGYREYVIAIDLARDEDFTAAVVLEDRRLPVLSPGIVLGPRQMRIVYADRFKNVDYATVCDYIRRLYLAPNYPKKRIIIDGGGVGGVVSDLLREQQIPHDAAIITGGDGWRRSRHPFVNISKTLLVENLGAALESGLLRFEEEMPLKAELESDLELFERKQTAAGNEIISQGRKAGSHGDLAIAAALACLSATHLRPGFQGQGTATGFW